MTCIVGLIKNGNVYMGGDSAGTSGLDTELRKDPKVFKNGDFLIGYTSSFRMGQLLRFKFTPPSIAEDIDIYTYMCTSFVDEVRKIFKEGGFSKNKESVETGGRFLVGYKGRLFQIDDDFQVGESFNSFNAVGCGDRYAKGALEVLVNYPVKFDSVEIVKYSLRVAEKFSAGVSGPFVIISDEKEQIEPTEN